MESGRNLQHKKMKPILTTDKSHTLFNENIGEHYHSTFGAVQESEHIFIEAGLKYITESKTEISILEMGFGTGLNALLSFKYALENNLTIDYFGIEAFPIQMGDAAKLNYPTILGMEKEFFLEMHKFDEGNIEISKRFSLQKKLCKLEETNLPSEKFNLVFFDAFSPEVQPELWTVDVFEKIFAAMKSGGVLTTYSCKGIVKRALRSAGFKIKRLPGPPGKREFLRAEKI